MVPADTNACPDEFATWLRCTSKEPGLGVHKRTANYYVRTDCGSAFTRKLEKYIFNVYLMLQIKCFFFPLTLFTVLHTNLSFIGKVCFPVFLQKAKRSSCLYGRPVLWVFVCSLRPRCKEAGESMDSASHDSASITASHVARFNRGWCRW